MTPLARYRGEEYPVKRLLFGADAKQTERDNADIGGLKRLVRWGYGGPARVASMTQSDA